KDRGRNIDRKTAAYSVRVSAAGYFREESAALRPVGGAIEFNARLKHGAPPHGTVLRPDGPPAGGAQIVQEGDFGIQVDNGILNPSIKQQALTTTTDAGGQFQLPASTKEVKLFILHDAGWTEVRGNASEAFDKITLRPWCRVEGRAM